MAPSAYTSLPLPCSSRWPSACSGGMYTGVPSTSPWRVMSEGSPSSSCTGRSTETSPARLSSRLPPTRRARPQSITSTSPNSPTMRLSGLRSRCITPRLWAKATAWLMRAKASRRRRNVHPEGASKNPSAREAPCTSSMTARRVRPRTSFMVNQSRPSSSLPWSCTATMPGCWRSAVILASVRNRARMCTDATKRARSTFIARTRWRTLSRTRHTSPKPPAAIRPRFS